MNPAIKSAGCFLFLLALCFFPVTDAAGMSFERDASNRIETVTDSFGRNVTYQQDADGQESFWTYDDRGNKLTETDPLGLTKTYTYDANDNMLSETDPLGHTTSYTYNERNDVLTTIDPMGNLTFQFAGGDATDQRVGVLGVAADAAHVVKLIRKS